MSGVGVEERPVDSNSVPSGPSGGQDPEWSSAFEYVVLRDSNQYERQMDSNRRGNFLLVVELFSSWCGPCQPVRSVLQRIFLATQRALGTTTMKERRDVGKNDIPSVAGLVAVRFCGLDPERIFEHAAQMRQASRPETTTSTSDVSQPGASQAKTSEWPSAYKLAHEAVRAFFHPETAEHDWYAALHMWRGTVEPVFLFFRKGVLLHVVEGPQARVIDLSCQTYQQASCASLLATSKVATTVREASRLAFKIQSFWRRQLQRRRLGEYIDGKFYTHEEIRQKAQREEEIRQQQVRLELMCRVVINLQRIYRGCRCRKEVEAQRKALKLKAKLAQSRRRQKKLGLLYTTACTLPKSAKTKLQALAKFRRGEPLSAAEQTLVHTKLHL